jgi:serine/threonine-protein phosphatase 5
MYGFEGEVKAKYSAQMVDLFTEVYNWLPLSHCINRKVLVMHGGLFAKVCPVTNDVSSGQRGCLAGKNNFQAFSQRPILINVDL